MKADQEEIACWCAILASDRSRGDDSVIALPLPSEPECDASFLAMWEAFRHVTTRLGKKIMAEDGLSVRESEPLEAFVYGRRVPSHLRWAETEAMIRAGEWEL